MAKKRESGEDILKAIMEKGGKSASFKLSEAPIERAGLGAQIKSAITPSLQSASKIEKVKEASSIEPSISGGKPGVLDSILEYSKVSADNSVELVSLTKSIKGLHEKNMEDNKELFERLLKSNDALKASLEENMREAGKGKGAGGAGASAGGFGTVPSESEDDSGKGGGVWDWVKTAGAGLAGAAGMKMLGGAKKVGAAAKGFGRGALKGGLIGGGGLLAYSMASQDVKDKLAEYGISEDVVGAAGGAAALGYGAYEAYKGVKGAGEPKVEAPKAQPKVEAPKAEPKVEAPKAEPKAEVKATPKTDPTKGAAEAAKSTIAKEAGETVSEKAGKTAGKDVIKKAIGKVASSKAVSSVAKKIPFIGALAGLGFALSRAIEGDYKGAAAEAVSGVAGATGVGAVGSLAIDAGLMARDIYKELYGIFPEDDQSSVREQRIKEIQAEVTDYIKQLVSSQEAGPTPEYDAMGNVIGQSFAPEPEKPSPRKVEPPTMFEGNADDMSLDFMTYPGTGKPPPQAPMTKEEYSAMQKEVSKERNREGGFLGLSSDNKLKKDDYTGNYTDEYGNVLTHADSIYKKMITTGKTPYEQRAEALSQAPAQQSSAPVIVKGGDTINNITNASGGGSGGAAGTPSRVPNPWDSLVFGNSWQAYP